MQATSPIEVLIVDDHAFLREGLRAVIDGQQDMHVVGEAETGEEAIDLFRRLRPHVVLMDLQMPGIGGVEATASIRRDFPDARIVVLTTFAGDAQALRALRAGASGYLLKNTLRKELLTAVRAVHGGRRHLSAEMATDIAIHALEDQLSDRELDVLSLAAKGRSNKEIGRDLKLSEETVKGNMKSAFSKLGASDRTHAVTIAAKRGMIEL